MLLILSDAVQGKFIRTNENLAAALQRRLCGILLVYHDQLEPDYGGPAALMVGNKPAEETGGNLQVFDHQGLFRPIRLHATIQPSFKQTSSQLLQTCCWPEQHQNKTNFSTSDSIHPKAPLATVGRETRIRPSTNINTSWS